MKWMWSVVGLALIVGLARPVAAQESGEDPAVRHRIVDARAGAVLTVFEAPVGSALFEVADARVTVRKRIEAGRAVTTIRTTAEHLEVALSPEGVRLAGTHGVLDVRRGDPAASGEARRRLRASHAIGEALALLGRLTPTVTSSVVQSLVSSRIVLGALRGDEDVRRLALRAQPVSPRMTPRVVTVSLVAQDPSPDGPGHCWDAYAEEAIEAWMEYEDCVDNEDWYDVAGLAACLAIYEMRAIGAFSWWLSCSAIRS